MTQNTIGRGFVKGPAKPLIPDGEYESRIVKAERCFAFGEKVLIQFIVYHECNELIIPMFSNIKVNDTREMLEPGRSSKLGKTLRRLLPNTPFGNVTLDSLLNLTCLVLIKTSKSDSDRKEKPKEDWYSTVHEVLGVIDRESPEDDIPF